MSRSLRRHVLISAALILTVVVGSAACGQPDFLGPGATSENDDTTTTNGTTPTASGDDDEDCTDDAAEADDTKSSADDAAGAACCEDLLPGKAHCSTTVSASSSASLNACPSGGFCVPDAMRGGATLKSCTSALGAGACVSLCVKKVADNKGSLEQATCGTNELCAPCINPIDKKDTGLCGAQKSSAATPAAKKTCTKKKAAPTTTASDDGESDAPAAGGADGTELCCSGKGKCVPAAAAGGDVGNLEQKECASADSVCAPSEMIPKASFKPKTCKAHAITGDYEGVCLSKCLKLSTIQSIVVEQGDCDDDHDCAPCKYPFIGKATGAPGCE